MINHQPDVVIKYRQPSSPVVNSAYAQETPGIADFSECDVPVSR
jgi:hypothetical protein